MAEEYVSQDQHRADIDALRLELASMRALLDQPVDMISEIYRGQYSEEWQRRAQIESSASSSLNFGIGIAQGASFYSIESSE